MGKRPKLRRLGPGSWWVPGQRILSIARISPGSVGTNNVEQYGDGLYIPVVKTR